MLKAKKPEPKEKRLKMFVYGAAGVGKTTGIIEFPSAYIIDTEKGTDFYHDTINKQGSVVLQTLNIDEIKEELRALAVEQHSYKTLEIDPITQVYNNVQEKWTRIFEKHAKTEKAAEIQDFGLRYWGKVKGDFKGLQRLMLVLDMNVIITAHQKNLYGTGATKIGTTFDSMRDDDYLFDLVFQLERRNGLLIAKTIKERAEKGKNKFPPEFDWSYDNFCELYGRKIIEKVAEPIALATKEQVAKANALIEVVKVDEKTIDKWIAKADVDSLEEMTSDQVVKIIDFLQKKVASVKE